MSSVIVIFTISIVDLPNSFQLNSHLFFIMIETAVKKLPIRLGQYLKFIDVVQDGHEAKLRINQEEVLVNGTIEQRRGKQLNVGDQVTIDNKTFVIISKNS